LNRRPHRRKFIGSAEIEIVLRLAPGIELARVTTMSHSSKPRRAVIWLQEDGTAVSCEEKLKVLNENLEEIRQSCQDAFEDALLMDCDEEQIRQVFASVIDSLKNPYRKG
jgi:hypothetical protein